MSEITTPFQLPPAIYGEGFIGMKREHYDRMRAAVECAAAMDLPTHEGHAVLNRYGWACGGHGLTASEFVRRMQRAALSDEERSK